MNYTDDPDIAELKRYASAMNHRTREMGRSGVISAEQLRSCILESGGQCGWCGISLVSDQFEIDHVLSLGQGGHNIPSNLVLSCENCNRVKAEKHPARFAAEVYASSGIKTPLITRLLNKYDIQHLAQKRMFWDELDDDNRADFLTSENASVPPYEW